MISNEHIWAVILAAGEGERVRGLTRDRWGHAAPKQYASIDGSTTLLGITVERAKKLSPLERIVPIVAEQHQRWWATELAEIPPENVIVQPENRGTAAGILLPLLWITERDPDALLVILPSDHGVASEDTLHTAIMNALLGTASARAGLVLLGVTPERPEPGYGWILPRPGERDGLHPIATFREKPDAAAAASLLGRGALLNSFILIADGRFLLNLFETDLPQLWQPLHPVFDEGWDRPERNRDLSRLYRSIPVLDFSKDLLERSAEKLWVYPVPACGWLDLGTPDRLTRHLSGQDRPEWSCQVQTIPRNPARGPHYPTHGDSKALRRWPGLELGLWPENRSCHSTDGKTRSIENIAVLP